MEKEEFAKIIDTNIAWCIENGTQLWDADFNQIESLQYPLSAEDRAFLAKQHPVFAGLEDICHDRKGVENNLHQLG